MPGVLSGKILTVAQFAKLMGVSRNTVYRWIAKGEVPTFQLGGKTRISLSAVRAAIPAAHEAILDQMSEVCETTLEENFSPKKTVTSCPIAPPIGPY